VINRRQAQRSRIVPLDNRLVAALFAASLLFPVSAQAQSLCDLLPALKVKSILDIRAALAASQNMEWGNGCDYSIPQASQPVVEAEASDDTGMDSLALTNHAASLNDDDQRVSGIGEVAIYTDDPHAQDPSAPTVFYTRQSLIFRTEDKIVDFVIISNSDAPTEAEVLSLGKFAASEPLDSLKDPQN
jgi:hypothetical protein